MAPPSASENTKCPGTGRRIPTTMARLIRQGRPLVPEAWSALEDIAARHRCAAKGADAANTKRSCSPDCETTGSGPGGC